MNSVFKTILTVLHISLSPLVFADSVPVEEHANLKTAKEMISAVESKNLMKLMAYFSEDIIFAQPYNPHSKDFAYKGKNEVRAGFTGIFQLIGSIGYTNPRYIPKLLQDTRLQRVNKRI